MRRFSSRTLLAAASAALAAVLLVAGSLLLWGSAYVHNTVQGQLASQQIYFPPASPRLRTPRPAPRSRPA